MNGVSQGMLGRIVSVVALTLGSMAAACNDNENLGEGERATCTSSIANDHGHGLAVRVEDVAARENRSYDISGSAGHPHTVGLSTADFDTLADGLALTVTSSAEAGHSHDVTIECH